MFGGIGGYYGSTWTAGRVVANGITGGVSSEIGGGSFEKGAIAGPIGGKLSGVLGITGSTLGEEIVRGAIIGGLAGGLSSVAMGGSFQDGFVGGAITGGITAGIMHFALGGAQNDESAGLGQIHLDGTGTLFLQPDNMQVGQFDLKKTFAWGGVYGGSTTIEDLVPVFAEGVAVAVTGQTEESKKAKR